MAQLRSATDQNLVRLLRARAEGDPAFRESLARELTAEAKYKDYVQRKRDEGGPVLSPEEWEVWVFGKDREGPEADKPGEAEPAKSKPTFGERRREDRMKRIRDTVKKRQRMKAMKQFWDFQEGTPRKPKRLFPSSETRDLPKWANQTTNNPDRLFAQADEAQPLMLDWLDRGEGIDKALGATTIRRDQDPKAEIDYSQEGPLVVIGPRKTEGAARDKIKKRYTSEGVEDWQGGAVDLVRATIAVDDYGELEGVIEKLKKSGIDIVSKPRNRFRTNDPSGYKDLVLSARLPNGHIMELQLHLKLLLKAKDEAHPLYKEIREFVDVDKESLSEEEKLLITETTMRTRGIYNKYWEQVARPATIFDPPVLKEDPTTTPVRRRRRAGEEETEAPQYFDVDGLPVVWADGFKPRIDHGSSEKHWVNDFLWFTQRACPIRKEEFDILVDDRRKVYKELKEDKGDKGKKKKAQDSTLLSVMQRRAAADPEFRRALQKAMRARKENS